MAAKEQEKRRPNIQKVMFTGNVTADAKLEHGKESGKSYLRFGVAVSVNTGTLFLNVTIFDKFAEAMEPHLVKGQCQAPNL